MKEKPTFRLRSKKSLSQIFLTNSNIAKKTVEALDLEEDEIVIEIGPGKGVLTKYLVQKAKKVFAVEIDKRLYQYLRKRFFRNENLILINQDILKIDLRQLIHPYQSTKIIGNLPYQITSPFFSLLLENKDLISMCVLMVQKEVAERICAQPQTRDWSPFSIRVQLYSEATILFTLKPSFFSPPPKVESSVIKLVFLKKSRIDIPNSELFFRVVEASFGLRRKTILNSLSFNLNLPKEKVKEVLNEISIDPKRRAESLSMQEFVTLSEIVSLKKNIL